MRLGSLVFLLIGCGASEPAPSTATATATPTSTSTSTPTPTPPPTPTSTSTPTPTPTPPPATGGSLLLGDIVAPKNFDPKPVLETLKPKMLACYNQTRASNPSLRGKLKLRIVVNEGGVVLNVEADPDGSANDPALVACIGDAMKAAHFPKPGGTATVTAPVVFRP